MKLSFDSASQNRTQADPYIFADGGRYYLYVTATSGVEAYTADSLCGEWHFEGVIGTIEGGRNFWAPCILKYGGNYYIYVSCERGDYVQCLHVLESDHPLGPFTGAKKLYNRFTIDAHVVETQAGLFLWYAEDNEKPERLGTRIYVDRLVDPYTPAHAPKEIIVPTFDEEIFRRDRFEVGRHWHTIEGAFWFQEGDWQYVMYSGGCYMNDTYHIGYAAARSSEADLTKVDFIKHTEEGRFAPVLIRNDYEEGVGHHSVIQLDDQYYAVYHGRDLRPADDKTYIERRTARICKLHVQNGIITAERYPDTL